MYKQKDFYFKKAKEEGFRARSVYKLFNLNKKYHIISKNNKVLDLGCSPGSWLQASLKIVGTNGFVLGIDIIPIKEIKNTKFIQADITEKETIEKIKSISDNFDVIISDLSPKTSGIKELDNEKSIQLNEAALKISEQVIKENGNFLCKIFQGPYFQEFLKNISKKFKFVKCHKPEASRKESKEIYIIAKGFKK